MRCVRMRRAGTTWGLTIMMADRERRQQRASPVRHGQGKSRRSGVQWVEPRGGGTACGDQAEGGSTKVLCTSEDMHYKAAIHSNQVDDDTLLCLVCYLRLHKKF